MPSQERVRSHNRGDLGQHLPSRSFGLRGQSSSLVIVEAKPTASELHPKDPVLFAKSQKPSVFRPIRVFRSIRDFSPSGGHHHDRDARGVITTSRATTARKPAMGQCRDCLRPSVPRYSACPSPASCKLALPHENRSPPSLMTSRSAISRDGHSRSGKDESVQGGDGSALRFHPADRTCIQSTLFHRRAVGARRRKFHRTVFQDYVRSCGAFRPIAKRRRASACVGP